MFGLDQAVVASGSFRFIRRPLQALVPQPIEVLPFLLETRRRLQRQREGGGREGGEDPLTDEGIDGVPREILAIGPTIGGGQPIARVAMPLAWPPVAHLLRQWHRPQTSTPANRDGPCRTAPIVSARARLASKRARL